MSNENTQSTNKTKFVNRNLTNILLMVAVWLFLYTIFDSAFIIIVISLLSAAYVVIGLVWTFTNEWTDNDEKERTEDFYARNMGKAYNINWIVFAILLIWGSWNIGKNSVFIYNNSIIYNKTFEQKTTEKKGFYDKLWKTYLQKEKIATVNKDVFIEITKVIFTGRADGQAVTWKWVHENQQINYDQYVQFYRDLSVFIESQRKEYFDIEVQCQKIAQAHNMLIDTFPNNWYNKIVGREHINFEYGFLSDSTNKVFDTKKENLK